MLNHRRLMSAVAPRSPRACRTDSPGSGDHADSLDHFSLFDGDFATVVAAFTAYGVINVP